MTGYQVWKETYDSNSPQSDVYLNYDKCLAKLLGLVKEENIEMELLNAGFDYSGTPHVYNLLRETPQKIWKGGYKDTTRISIEEVDIIE